MDSDRAARTGEAILVGGVLPGHVVGGGNDAPPPPPGAPGQVGGNGSEYAAQTALKTAAFLKAYRDHPSGGG